MESEYYFNFTNAYVDKEYLYAVDFENNIFFRAKRDHGYKAEVLGVLDGFQHENAGKILDIYYYENSLYMFSNRTYEIAKYSIDTGEFVYFHPELHHEVFRRVRATCRVGNDVWILRDTFEGLYCVFSLEDCEYRFFNPDNSELLKCAGIKGIKQIAKETVCLVDGKLWRCVPGTKYVYSVDVETKELKVFELPLDVELYTINYSGEFFYLLSIYGDCIIRWDEKKGFLDKIEVNYGERTFKAFRNVFYENRHYILIPGLFGEIKILPENGGNIRTFELPAGFEEVSGINRGLFSGYYKEENRILLFPYSGNGLAELDHSQWEARFYPVSIEWKEYMKIHMGMTPYIFEDTYASLEEYLFFIGDKDADAKEKDNTRRGIGTMIMQKLKEFI